jgi:hypothetical protein
MDAVEVCGREDGALQRSCGTFSFGLDSGDSNNRTKRMSLMGRKQWSKVSYEMHELMKPAQCEERYIELAEVARQYFKATVVSVPVDRRDPRPPQQPVKKPGGQAQKAKKDIQPKAESSADVAEQGDLEHAAQLSPIKRFGGPKKGKVAKQRVKNKWKKIAPVVPAVAAVNGRMTARSHTAKDIESYGSLHSSDMSSDDSLLQESADSSYSSDADDGWRTSRRDNTVRPLRFQSITDSLVVGTDAAARFNIVNEGGVPADLDVLWTAHEPLPVEHVSDAPLHVDGCVDEGDFGAEAGDDEWALQSLQSCESDADGWDRLGSDEDDPEPSAKRRRIIDAADTREEIEGDGLYRPTLEVIEQVRNKIAGDTDTPVDIKVEPVSPLPLYADEPVAPMEVEEATAENTVSERVLHNVSHEWDETMIVGAAGSVTPVVAGVVSTATPLPTPLSHRELQILVAASSSSPHAAKEILLLESPEQAEGQRAASGWDASTWSENEVRLLQSLLPEELYHKRHVNWRYIARIMERSRRDVRAHAQLLRRDLRARMKARCALRRYGVGSSDLVSGNANDAATSNIVDNNEPAETNPPNGPADREDQGMNCDAAKELVNHHPAVAYCEVEDIPPSSSSSSSSRRTATEAPEVGSSVDQITQAQPPIGATTASTAQRWRQCPVARPIRSLNPLSITPSALKISGAQEDNCGPVSNPGSVFGHALLRGLMGGIPIAAAVAGEAVTLPLPVSQPGRERKRKKTGFILPGILTMVRFILAFKCSVHIFLAITLSICAGRAASVGCPVTQMYGQRAWNS